MKYIRLAIEPTDLRHLFCIVCGRANPYVEFAVVNGAEPETGIHRDCIERAHQKRGQGAD